MTKTLYRHILFAADLSPICTRMVPRLKRVFNFFNTKATLVHTVEPIPSYGYPGFEDLTSPLIEHAREEMAKLGEELKVPTSQQRIEFGSVKHEILKVAEELNVDLIIICSHGRHGLSRLLGSGANAIVHGADCDVLTVRCTEDE